jgi:hypothetical protein
MFPLLRVTVSRLARSEPPHLIEVEGAADSSKPIDGGGNGSAELTEALLP